MCVFVKIVLFEQKIINIRTRHPYIVSLGLLAPPPRRPSRRSGTGSARDARAPAIPHTVTIPHQTTAATTCTNRPHDTNAAHHHHRSPHHHTSTAQTTSTPAPPTHAHAQAQRHKRAHTINTHPIHTKLLFSRDRDGRRRRQLGRRARHGRRRRLLRHTVRRRRASMRRGAYPQLLERE